MRERAGPPAAGAGAILGGTLLFYFDPACSRLFPPCIFHLVTGFQCPGCGSLRAIHQLLHGHIASAFTLNPLLVLVLPVALALEAAPRLTKKRVVLPPAAVIAFVALTVTFGILRNLP